MATTVGTIRDLNNRYGAGRVPSGGLKVLVCPECGGWFSADLARYWCPRDGETFGCPVCDVPLWLQFQSVVGEVPLAQRYPQASARQGP